MGEAGSTENPGASRAFPDTLWTAVLGARDPADPTFGESLERLVRLYWKPVYWVIRSRWSKSPDEAKDLTQDFFASFLERDRLRDVGPERGRFRSYVRVILENDLRNAHARGKARKRGGDVRLVPLEGEGDLPLAASELSPGALLDRSWALCLFREAAAEVATRLRATGHETRLAAFERYDLAPSEPPTYEALGRELGIDSAAVDNHLRAARALFREVLRARVRETLADPADLESELRALAQALRG